MAPERESRLASRPSLPSGSEAHVDEGRRMAYAGQAEGVRVRCETHAVRTLHTKFDTHI